jgi:hypothetical protein
VGRLRKAGLVSPAEGLAQSGSDLGRRADNNRWTDFVASLAQSMMPDRHGLTSRVSRTKELWSRGPAPEYLASPGNCSVSVMDPEIEQGGSMKIAFASDDIGMFLGAGSSGGLRVATQRHPDTDSLIGRNGCPCSGPTTDGASSASPRATAVAALRVHSGQSASGSFSAIAPKRRAS